MFVSGDYFFDSNLIKFKENCHETGPVDETVIGFEEEYPEVLPVEGFLKEFRENYPEMLPISGVTLATIVSDQLVNLGLSDVSGAFFLKSAQRIFEHWQLGQDPEDNEENGDKPAWIKQAGVVAAAAGWTLAASYLGYGIVAIAGAKLTATLLKNMMRKLEDISIPYVENIPSLGENPEVAQKRARLAINAIVISALIAGGFTTDMLVSAGLQCGQIATGVGISVFDREFRLLLDPIKDKINKTKTPRSKLRLVSMTALAAASAVASKIYGGSLVLTDALTDTLATAVKQIQKNNHVQRANERRAEKPNATEKKAKAKAPSEPLLSEAAAAPKEASKIKKKDKEKKEKKEQKKAASEVAATDARPSFGAQVGAGVAILGASYATSFFNVPLVEAALSKVGSRALHYATNVVKKPWVARLTYAAPLAVAGGVLEFFRGGVPVAVGEAADLALSVATIESDLNLKDWQLGKGVFSQKPALEPV